MRRPTAFAPMRRTLVDRRGLALPLAMLALLVLAGLTAAFVAMGGMEPFIATNHRAASQALGLAEAGIERSIWALATGEVNPAAPGSLPNPLPSPVPAPYDGTQLIALGPDGGYSVNVCMPDTGACPPPSPDRRDRNVTAVGFVMRQGTILPADPATLNRADRAARKTVTATLTYIGPPDPPGALTVAGSVDLGGATTIDGINRALGTPNGCPQKAGVTIRDRSPGPDGVLGTPDDISHTTSTSGSASVDGAPVQQVVDEQTFNQYLFSNDQLATLRNYARSHGRYIRPPNNDLMSLTVTDGLIFIDTVNGAPIGNPPDPTVLARVKIDSANNSGWIIVLGSLQIDGNVTYNGLIYALNDLEYRGTETSGIYGSVISANIVDSGSTVIDTSMLGSSRIYFDCQKVANGNGSFTPPRGYLVKGGTWRETPN